jgi:hypothetical protein
VLHAFTLVNFLTKSSGNIFIFRQVELKINDVHSKTGDANSFLSVANSCGANSVNLFYASRQINRSILKHVELIKYFIIILLCYLARPDKINVIDIL